MNIEIQKKREELIKYFRKNGIENDGRTVFIVDIGWRGTIQDNIAYIFDKNKFIGYYLTLYNYYNVQPVNTKK